MISILIATKNRPEKINKCITSILNNSYQDFEIIILDSSYDSRTRDIIKRFHYDKIYYYFLKNKDKSSALNFGIKKSKGEIITITDDDIITSKRWLEDIRKSFEVNKDCIVIYGRVLPYQKQRHNGLKCPLSDKQFKYQHKFITLPDKRYIFNANNVSFRSKNFKNNFEFKEWLGVGSIGQATEDEEIAFRILKTGGIILYNPKIKVYHDRWVTKQEFYYRSRRYEVGFWACYGYHALKGERMAYGYIINFLKFYIRAMKKDLTYCIRGFHPKVLIKASLQYLTRIIFYWSRGFFIGLYFSLKEQL